MSNESSNSTKKSYKNTLNLPHTEFPIRPNAKVDDPEMIKRWESEDLFYKTFISNKDNKKFILHDGPPYANGNIHLGHAYNKILKDIVCKSRRMSGFHVPVIPGWDCHGLPIELKVMQENPDLEGVEIKKACRAYAQSWVDIQKNSFKDLGILMNWDNPYITMSPSYESNTVKAFGRLVKEGFIERKNKTVPWCFSCQTVLASAEIEYQDRKDPSIYVLFKLDNDSHKRLFADVDKPINFLVWTTTPWTIPLNRAVLLKSGAQYKLIEINDTVLIVGAQVADKIAQRMDADYTVLKEFTADELKDSFAEHPLSSNNMPIIFDESVGLEEGTACVHSAPGCGPIDYEIGVKNKLEIYSPLSASGKYTCGIEPKELEDMAVTEGQIWVLRKLKELGKLFYKENIKHSYPHCWRCHKGLMFRATPQWFFSLDKQNIKQKALNSVEDILFIPPQGRSFLRSTIANRWEWCLSRQRTWGAPIPALLCKSCDYTYISEELVNFVAENIKNEGIEYWDRVSVKELVEYLTGTLGLDNVTCPECKSSEFKKETDILDVWFDSGISHYAVLYNNPEQKFPANLYLEGVDQYRGWFQSSLLTSLVLEKEPAMDAIMAHGFTVDEKGRKMSKSLGNVVSPDEIREKLGTDGLRLWVASIGHEGDAVVSKAVLSNIAIVFRKIRNTCRFLLSNLYDFDKSSDAIELDQLMKIDKYALYRLDKINNTILDAYKENNFTLVFHTLADYCSTELSSFYLDIIKDRLYVDKKDGYARRSAQTAVWHILDTLVRLIAPILSFTAEQLSDLYQSDKQESIHLQDFKDTQEFSNLGDEKAWQLLKQIRTQILKSIEQKREEGEIKHSLEADVTLSINLNNNKYQDIQEYLTEEFLKEFLIVSQFTLKDDDTLDEDFTVDVERADGVKCPRCWHWSKSADQDDLCKRCKAIIESL